MFLIKASGIFLILSDRVLLNHHGHKINSGFMYFKNLEIAKNICTKWAEEFGKDHCIGLKMNMMNMGFNDCIDMNWIIK
jgi:hypothetical protein